VDEAPMILLAFERLFAQGAFLPVPGTASRSRPLRAWKAGIKRMNLPLALVLAAAAIAVWALMFRGMDQALPDRTREFRRRLAAGPAANRRERSAAAAPRAPLHPALVVALVLAILAVGILIGQERQGLGATQEPLTEVAHQEDADKAKGSDTEDSDSKGSATDAKDSDSEGSDNDD
jgi:hypothetical protein